MSRELTQDDLSILQRYVERGDRAGYWSYLSLLGDPYAGLASQVVNNNSFNGFVANQYAETVASANGIQLTPEQWEKVGRDLIAEDWAQRSDLVDRQRGGDALFLPFDQIRRSHEVAFAANGLSMEAWTAWPPIKYAYESGDFARAQSLWNGMVESGFVSSAVNSTITFVNADPEWRTRIAGIAFDYANAGADSVSNPNYVDGYVYIAAQGQWYRASASAALTGLAFQAASPDEAQQLNAVRLQRIVNSGVGVLDSNDARALAAANTIVSDANAAQGATATPQPTVDPTRPSSAVWVNQTGAHTATLNVPRDGFSAGLLGIVAIENSRGNRISLNDLLANNPSITNANAVQAGQPIQVPQRSGDELTLHYTNGTTIVTNRVTGEYSIVAPNSDGSGGVTLYERTADGTGGFTVRQVSTNVSGDVTFESTGRQATLDDAIVPIETTATLSDNVVIAERYDQGSVVERGIGERAGDGSTSLRIFDRQGNYIELRETQFFDDGSSITTAQLPDGATRTTTRDTDNAITSIVEDRQTGTTRQSTVMDGAGNVLETGATQTFDDGSSIRDVTRPDGSTVHTVLGSDGRPTSITGTAAPLQSFGTAIQDLNSLASAIRSGRPLPILSSGLTLIDNQVNPTINGTQTFNNQPLYTTTAVVSAATSLYSLHQAFSGDGTDVQRFTSTAYAIVAINNVANAVATEVAGVAAEQIASTALNSVAGGISTALPFVNIALSLSQGNYVGAAVGVAAMAFPVVGWVYAAYTLITAIGDEPPEAWATGHFRFATPNDVANAGDIKAVAAANILRVVAPGTSQFDPLNVQADITGDAFGPERVRLLLQGNGAAPGSANYFGGVLGELDRIIDSQMQDAPDRPLGIIPQRLPTLSWHEARQNEPGYSVTDIDPLTGQERLPQLRYNDDWTPYNADPTDPAQRRNVFERLITSALDREAIAPLWEVQTARLQQDIGDPNAGLTEEVRAAHRGLLAPVNTVTNERLPGEFRPVALDLNGDGRITTVSNADNNRAFNWDGSGYDKEVGWVGGGEGLLFVDRNLNGAVDNGRDLFSNSLVADAAKGVRSLTFVDANADGVLNGADPVFSQLRVWQDANGNAFAEQGELQSLAALGITSLDYANGRFTRNGEYFAMQSPTLETSSEGSRAAVLPEGIRVEFSDGQATLYVTSVTDLGAGNDGIAAVEDGGQDYVAGPNNTRVPIGQSSARRDPISILPSLLLQNDSVNGSNAGLTITAVGNASVGSVSINAQTGAIQFLAPQHFNGPATFEYTVKAPDGQSQTATVTVDVAPVNDRPVISSSEAQARRVYGYQPLTYSFQYLTYDEGDNRLAYQTRSGTANGAPIYSPYTTEIKGAPIYGPEYQVGPYDARETVRDIIGYQPSTYVRHDATVATERATTGRLAVSDVEGDTRVSYSVIADGLYGHASVNADGSWSYEAYRPNGVAVGDVNADGAADYANPNTGEVFTRSPGNAYLQNRYGGDEASASFIDRFTVRATAADGSSQDVPIEVMHYGPRPLSNVQSGAKKPIAIDLDGDGFHFTDVDDSNVFFDVNGDGWRRRMAWNNPQDGLLAYDKNGDGQISDFDEISFVPYDTDGRTDLESLRRAFDTNGDGVFSAADAKWNSFGVWQDANSNGVSDPGEFRSLGDLGIAQIGLTSDGRFQVIDGQSVHGTATATRTDGSTLAIADVTLRWRNETQVTGSNGVTTTATLPAFASGQQIVGTAGADLVFGTSGNDQYVMGDGNDVINDDAGNDLVDAGAGDDLVFTGIDNDYVDAGAGNDTVFTGAGDDIVIAGDGDDFVSLEGGNDIVFGANGNDMLSGGFGNDLLSGDAGVDKLFGEGGWDQLFGGADDDELWGMDGNDHLNGGAGNDSLAGGDGDDTMEGGAGNDTYEVDSAADVVTELANAGEDGVRSSITYALGANLENLTLTGTVSINGVGNASNNVMVGNGAANTLRGLAGNDTLDGGKGADVLIGGVGNDTYVIDDAGDQVIEAAGEGVDTVRSRVGVSLGANVENLVLTGIAAINGTGNALDNQIDGNAAANTLAGGRGNDLLSGGGGYDTYVFARGDGSDTVVDRLGDGSIAFGGGIARTDLEYALDGNDLIVTLLSGGQPTSDTLRLVDWALGGQRVNAIGFAGGSSMVLDESVLNHAPVAHADVAATNEDAAVVAGNVLANDTDEDKDQVLSVIGAGARTGQYGTLTLNANGSYAYAVNSVAVQRLAVGQTVSESFGYVVTDNAYRPATASSTLTVTIEGRNDAPVVTTQVADSDVKVLRPIDVALPSGLFADVDQGDRLVYGARLATGAELPSWLVFDAQNLRFTGQAPRSMRNQSLTLELSATDVAGASVSTTVVLHFNSIGETIIGTSASESLAGTDLDDRLIGLAGNDLLDGGEGEDTMEGGAGDDTYVVESAGDRVVEAAGAGYDTVRTGISLTLTDNVEALVQTGSAGIEGIGNALDNRLTGNTGANTLRGGAGNDTIDGGTGADTMVGGQGNDSYVVDQVGDRVIEAVGEGFDQVSAGIDYVLPENVEQLTLTGNAVRATGNALDNLLFGNAQANVIDGGAGNDRMEGGAGDDRYTVDAVGDTIVEAAGGGNDTVYASVTQTLANEVENLILTGTVSLDGTGNAGNNVLVGNTATNRLMAGAGNDVLAGGQGDDTLDGGTGNDLYLWNQGEGHDLVSDALGTDTIRFGAGITVDALAARYITVAGSQRVFVSLLDADGQETSQGIELTSPNAIERFELANGSTVALSDLLVTTRSLTGTHGNDVMTGDRRDDTLDGSNGNDTLYGRSGNDNLLGGNGNDALFGEGGNDKLYGDNGDDELWGGAGNDLLDGNNGRDILVGGKGNDQLFGGNDNDVLDGGAGNDTLDGSNGADELYAGDGDDTLDGGNDADLLAGGAGNDTLLGGNGQDVIVAGAGNDRVDGGNDADFVDAGAGDDMIIVGNGADFVAGGRGNDTLDLGNDKDVIAINRGDGADTILPFSWQQDTVSLGSGIRYADLALRKTGNDLVLDLGAGDSLTFKDWYATTENRNLGTLQVVTATGGDYNAASSDRLRNRRVVAFDFGQLVSRFDVARTTNPSMTSWSMTGSLNSTYKSGSDTQAIGGDLTWRYAMTGSYGDLDASAVRARLNGFGGDSWQTFSAGTTVNPWTALQAGISLMADRTVGLPSPLTPMNAPNPTDLATAALAVGQQRPSWLQQASQP